MTIKKIKKVLFFTYWYPNSYEKLSGIFIKEHATALNIYFDVAVFFIFSDPNLKSLIKFEIIKDEGVLLFRYSHKKFKSRYSFATLFLYLVCSIIGYFRILKIWGKADINHVHVLTRSAIIPLIVKKTQGTPFFISEHWSRYLSNRNTYNGFFRKILTKYVVKECAGISSVSADLRLAMEGHDLKNLNFVTISNVVNTQKFQPDALKQENKVFKFLHVSGLTDSIKNVSGILKVIKELKDKGYKFIIDFIGNDSDRLALEDFSISLNLSDLSFFHGELYGDDLIKYYQQADAFVSFSNFENQPCVLLESFCCGLPVIATLVGGIPEIVNESNGLLVGVKDESGLANAMKLFLNKQVVFNSKTIRDQAIQKYSYDSVAQQFISFYNNQT